MQYRDPLLWASRGEIPRRGVRFLDLGDLKRNRRLVNLFHWIGRAFSSARLDGARSASSRTGSPT